MTKALLKAIMKRSELRKKFLKSRILFDSKNYASQRNICKKLLKKTRKDQISVIQTLGTLLITKHFGKLPFHSFLANFQKSRK